MRKTTLSRLWPLALLALVAGLIALAVTKSADRPAPFAEVLAGTPASEQPDLGGQTVAGATFSLESLRGRPVLINVADERGDALASIDDYDWTFPSVFDPDRSLAGQLGASYQPFYALLDEEGRLVASSLSGNVIGWSKFLEALEVT